MRFFIASGCPIATTSLYRCVHLGEQLRALGHETRMVDWFDEANIVPQDAVGYGAIFLYRLPMSRLLEAVIRAARDAKIPTLFDTDDLVFEPELVAAQRGVSKLSPQDQERHLDGVRRYLRTLESCDAVTTATPFLAELAGRRGKKAFVHRNALGDEMLALADQLCAQPKVGERLVIGYGSGTPTHDFDFAEAAPALAAILTRYAFVELWLVGPLAISEDLTAFGERVRRFPLTDWQGWFERARQFDIALAPLEIGNLFCRAKSEIKFVEAGALGVPVVASRMEPFVETITHHENGMLAANESEWTDALSWLVENPEERAAMGARARATVLQRYTPEARTADLAAILPRLLAARKEDASTHA